jgi:hypothetical protein
VAGRGVWWPTRGRQSLCAVVREKLAREVGSEEAGRSPCGAEEDEVVEGP